MWKKAGRLDLGRQNLCLPEAAERERDVPKEGGRASLRMGSFSKENVLTYIPDQGEKEM